MMSQQHTGWFHVQGRLGGIQIWRKGTTVGFFAFDSNALSPLRFSRSVFCVCAFQLLLTCCVVFLLFCFPFSLILSFISSVLSCWFLLFSFSFLSQEVVYSSPCLTGAVIPNSENCSILCQDP